jgi:predicted GNAT family acetyltransferase
VTTPETGVEIFNDGEVSAYVISVDGERVGKAEYLVRDGRHVFFHTEVNEDYAGSGLASRLVQHALDDVRSQQGQIVPLCPYVSAYIRRHPEYENLVDHEMWTSMKTRLKR